jgi:hypothetical protein
MPTAERITSKRETWRDWFPNDKPKLSVDDLLQIANDMDLDLDLSTLRFWQTEGILPYPNRRKIGTGTYAVYPAVALLVIERIRVMQKSGLTLKEIAPRVQGILATWNDPDPFNLGPAIRTATRQYEERFGVTVAQVMVTFTSTTRDDGSYVFTLLDNQNSSDVL